MDLFILKTPVIDTTEMKESNITITIYADQYKTNFRYQV